MPSSPEIQEVEPFSSTAVVHFMEPDAMGGVPLFKYRVQWRVPGLTWAGKEYEAEDGKSCISPDWLFFWTSQASIKHFLIIITQEIVSCVF